MRLSHRGDSSLLTGADVRPCRVLEAKQVFGDNDEAHPSVKYLFHTAGEYYVGGKIEAINRLQHYDFLELRCECDAGLGLGRSPWPATRCG